MADTIILYKALLCMTSSGEAQPSLPGRVYLEGEKRGWGNIVPCDL